MIRGQTHVAAGTAQARRKADGCQLGAHLAASAGLQV